MGFYSLAGNKEAAYKVMDSLENGVMESYVIHNVSLVFGSMNKKEGETEENYVWYTARIRLVPWIKGLHQAAVWSAQQKVQFVMGALKAVNKFSRVVMRARKANQEQ